MAGARNAKACAGSGSRDRNFHQPPVQLSIGLGQAQPGLSTAAVTTAALWSPPLTPPMVQEALVVPLCTTSGCTVVVHVPMTAFVCGSVIVKVTVDRARAPLLPPRFFKDAPTVHAEVQADVSTDTTV